MLTEFQLMFLLIGTRCVQGSYYVYEDSARWDVLRENCTLATPDILFTSGRLTPDVDDNITTLVQKTGADLWIGYYKAYGQFQYIGCVESTHVTKDVTKGEIIVKDIGKCFLACDYGLFIGVTRNESNFLTCKCLEAIEGSAKNMTSTSCTCDCGEGTKDAFSCGSQDGTAFSIYMAKGETSATGNKRCLYVDQGTDPIHWGRCDDDRVILCRNNYEDNLPAITDNTTEGNWSDIQRECFQKQMYPASVNSALNTSLDSSKGYWTGIVRNKVIYKRSAESLEFINSNRKYAYLTLLDDERVVMKFQKTRNLTALCETVVESETASTTASTPEASQVKSSAYTTKSSTGTITVAIASSTTGVVVLAVVVVLIFLWKRGTLPFSRGKTKPEELKIPAPQSYQNDSYVDGEELFDVTTNHNYFVLERCDTTGNGVDHLTTVHTNNGVGQADEEMQYATVDDDINAKKDLETTTTDNAMVASENVYNKLDLGDENQYDHIVHRENLKGHKTEQEGDYDTTNIITNAPLASDNVYNTLALEENYQYAITNLTAAKGSERVLENDYDTINGVHK